MLLKPKVLARKNPKMKAKVSCTIPAIMAGLPTSLSFLKFSSNPTMKSRNAMPRVDMVMIMSWFVTSFSPIGPIIMPTTMVQQKQATG